MPQFSVQFMPTDQPLVMEMPPEELWSEEPPLESDLHREQIDRLIRLLKWHWRDRQDFYVSGNLTIYYNQQQFKSRDFRGPDFFVVLGAEQRDRKSWVIWQENGQYPHVIVELPSDSTVVVDRGLKKQLYQDVFRTPDYFWFHPHTLEFAGFHLSNGTYEPIVPNDQVYLWCKSLQLFFGVEDRHLRLFRADGTKVLLPEEEERQRAEADEAKVAALLKRLQEAGLESG